ncbi:MAG TPA: hypothetical protein VF245_12830 [Solirubrobacterales bacterium]
MAANRLGDELPSPRKYAEQVLGKGASAEQLDELFRLHAAAHPVVEHSTVYTRDPEDGRLPCCTVVILSHRPDQIGGPTARVIASGQAVCNPLDQWSRKLGVTIAFGRALTRLRMEVEGVRHATAA